MSMSMMAIVIAIMAIVIAMLAIIIAIVIAMNCHYYCKYGPLSLPLVWQVMDMIIAMYGH